MKLMPWPLRITATACLLGMILLNGSASAHLPADSSAHFPFAYAQFGCAPTDGPALDFYFTATKSECGKIVEPYLKIMIWENLPQSAPYTVKCAGEGGRDSLQKPGVCEAASSGSLHLDKFVNEKISAGDYEIHFRDGTVEKGSFDATWCHIRVVCG